MTKGALLLGSMVMAIVGFLAGCGDASGAATDNLYAPYDTASTSQATDPGTSATTPTSGSSSGNGNGSGAAPSSGGSATTDPDAGSSSPSLAPPSGNDAGSPAPPANAFSGASAYVATTGPSTIKSSHSFPGNNPVKQACLGCHSFTFGGSVFSDAAGTTPAVGVEIRMVDGSGAAHSSYTDANGNFYLDVGKLVGPASIGVRNGTSTHVMSGSITSGNCNSSSCHGGAQGFIHLP